MLPAFQQMILSLPPPPLPDPIITSVEGAEDGVARFTSLVRATDQHPISQALVNECH